MIKKLIKKYQAYKDKKFLVRLERVLSSKAVNSSLVLKGHLLVLGDVAASAINEVKDFEEGKSVSQILGGLHQECLAKLVSQR